MELLIMILAPLPIGFLIKERTAAFVTYVALQSFVFTFQTMALTREWVGGDTTAFAKSPDTVPWSYGVVNLVIFAIGLGLVEAGHRIAVRRRSHAGATVELAG